MKDKTILSRALALDNDEYLPPCEFPCGSIFLYASMENKNISPYQYWGRLNLPHGQLKYVRLWAFSTLKDVVYYKGYALDALDALSTIYTPPTSKDTGYFLLFNYPDAGAYDGENLKPHFTGKIYSGSETFLVLLWKREGHKGIYFSGTVEILKVDKRI